jgi:hypothetical protein
MPRKRFIGRSSWLRVSADGSNGGGSSWVASRQVKLHDICDAALGTSEFIPVTLLHSNTSSIIYAVAV